MAIEDEDTKDGEAAPPKKNFLTKKRLMIAVPVLALLLAGAGAGAYFFLAGPKPAASGDAAPPPQVAYSDVDDLLVNIQSPDSTPVYLKLSVALELDDDTAKAGVAVLMPRVRDAFEAYLRELRIDDLKGSEGVMRLKEELLRRAAIAAAPYHVRDVLLKQMIVQ